MSKYKVPLRVHLKIVKPPLIVKIDTMNVYGQFGPFRFETAIRQRKCHNCKGVIYKGKMCISFKYNNGGAKYTIKKNLCLYCIMAFVLSNIHDGKSYKKLLDEFVARKVAREL